MKKRGKCLLSVVLILTLVRPVLAAPLEIESAPVEVVMSTEAAETAPESAFLEEDTVAETATTESIETDTEETKETETETQETENEPDQSALISQITSATVDLKSVKC